MKKYIDNVNAYLAQMKIKQTFICLKSGIEPSKLSRLLKGTQDITGSDMEKIAEALGHKVEFFLADDFCVPAVNYSVENEVVFYAGEPGREQEEFAMKLVDLLENVDEVLGAEQRFKSAMMG